MRLRDECAVCLNRLHAPGSINGSKPKKGSSRKSPVQLHGVAKDLDELSHKMQPVSSRNVPDGASREPLGRILNKQEADSILARLRQSMPLLDSVLQAIGLLDNKLGANGHEELKSSSALAANYRNGLDRRKLLAWLTLLCFTEWHQTTIAMGTRTHNAGFSTPIRTMTGLLLKELHFPPW